MSQAMELITDVPSSREMEHRLNTLQTSLNTVERSIMKYENLIEDCQMQEEEAHLEEEIPQEQEEEDVTDVEMVGEEERGNPEPSGPPSLASAEDAVSPEEDTLLMQPAFQPEDPAAGSHSPRSKTGMVSGEMAELCLTSPSQPGHEEDETQP